MAVPVPNTADSVQIEWLGLMCESQPVMTVNQAPESLDIHLDHGPSPASCAAAGVEYRAVLHLDADATLIHFDVTETLSSPPPD